MDINIQQASSGHYHDIVRIYNQAIAAGYQTADENSVRNSIVLICLIIFIIKS